MNKKSFISLVSFLERIFPVKKLVFWLLVWGILLVVYRKILHPIPNLIDVPRWFPVFQFIGPNLNITGIPYAILFVILLGFTIWIFDRIKDYFIGCIGCVLIVLGNLVQGNFYKAFIFPLLGSIDQYYYDAIRIGNWHFWLATFNANQPDLALHSQTHPPFAVLLQKFFLDFTGEQTAGLAILLTLSSLIAVFLVMYILRCLQVEPQRRKRLLLLFCVLPAINIYSIVSLDAVILTTSTLFLLGLVVVLENPKKKWLGTCLMVAGFGGTSALTYGSLFLAGVGLLVAVYEIAVDKRWNVFIGMAITLFLFGLAILIMKLGIHYDHIQGFLTASKIENPNGFRLLSDPINYLLTRFDDISEILFFLSFGVLAVLFPIDWRKSKSSHSFWVAMSGIFVLLLMFLSGAFRTGETARACLFIYPYLLLLLIDLNPEMVKKLAVLAGAQTILMQFAGSFFW
jgi:hypothetical protein